MLKYVVVGIITIIVTWLCLEDVVENNICEVMGANGGSHE